MTAPKPLTPAGLDLRDFSWLPLDVVMLENSETWAMAGAIPYARGACISLWTRAWHQVPAASLPDNEMLLAKWADVPDWESCRQVALRGFVLCSDGRLYHKVLAVKANEAQMTREKSAAAREAERVRIKAWRDKQKRQQKQQSGNANSNSNVTHEYSANHTIPDHTPPSKEREYGSGSREEQRDGDAALASPPAEGGSLRDAKESDLLADLLGGGGTDPLNGVSAVGLGLWSKVMGRLEAELGVAPFQAWIADTSLDAFELIPDDGQREEHWRIDLRFPSQAKSSWTENRFGSEIISTWQAAIGDGLPVRIAYSGG